MHTAITKKQPPQISDWNGLKVHEIAVLGIFHVLRVCQIFPLAHTGRVFTILGLGNTLHKSCNSCSSVTSKTILCIALKDLTDLQSQHNILLTCLS